MQTVSIASVSLGVGTFGIWWWAWSTYGFWWGLLYLFTWPVPLCFNIARWLHAGGLL